LVLDPSILLVDEPSAGLDRITASEIDQLLLDLKTRKKVTLVLVTHDPAGARRFGDRLAVLEDGKFIGTGTAEELEKSDNDTVRKLVSARES
jgi:phospholipid/cholesterol/gamma-HCH transport system ATP-binding protein